MTSIAITLTGDLDFSRKAELDSQLAKAAYTNIAIVDVTGVEYLDSSTLSSLAGLKKLMREHGTAGILRIAGANESLRRILQICGLDKSFELYDSLEAAQNAKLANDRHRDQRVAALRSVAHDDA